MSEKWNSPRHAKQPGRVKEPSFAGWPTAVEAGGFKKLVRSGVSLNANDKLAIDDIELEVGAVTESVEVTAEAVLLQTESVERSATITGKQMENIEVNGRNPLDMAKLGRPQAGMPVEHRRGVHIMIGNGRPK